MRRWRFLILHKRFSSYFPPSLILGIKRCYVRLNRRTVVVKRACQIRHSAFAACELVSVSVYAVSQGLHLDSIILQYKSKRIVKLRCLQSAGRIDIVDKVYFFAVYVQFYFFIVFAQRYVQRVKGTEVQVSAREVNGIAVFNFGIYQREVGGGRCSAEIFKVSNKVARVVTRMA